MTLWSPRFLAGLLAFSFFLTACGEDDASARQGRRGGPIPVVAEPATLEAERLRLEAVGTSQARRSVELFAETTGDVAEVTFSPGDFVEEGSILVALEAEDEQLALALAEVQVADAQQLLERYRRANERGERTVPETTVDATKTALAAALIARDRATVALEKRRVRAPLRATWASPTLTPAIGWISVLPSRRLMIAPPCLSTLRYRKPISGPSPWAMEFRWKAGPPSP